MPLDDLRARHPEDVMRVPWSGGVCDECGDPLTDAPPSWYHTDCAWLREQRAEKAEGDLVIAMNACHMADDTVARALSRAASAEAARDDMERSLNYANAQWKVMSEAVCARIAERDAAEAEVERLKAENHRLQDYAATIEGISAEVHEHNVKLQAQLVAAEGAK